MLAREGKEKLCGVHPLPSRQAESNCTACTTCPHGKLKRFCAECKGCPHGERKQNCAECKERLF
jgi:hypothetical protein